MTLQLGEHHCPCRDWYHLPVFLLLKFAFASLESVETWISLDASGTVAGACATSNREGRMTFMVMILSVGLLSATGIYNPQVMRDGHCIAEPGTFDALYCPAPAAPSHKK